MHVAQSGYLVVQQPADCSPSSIHCKLEGGPQAQVVTRRQLSLLRPIFWAALFVFSTTLLNVALLPITLSSLQHPIPPWRLPFPSVYRATTVGEQSYPRQYNVTNVLPWHYANGSQIIDMVLQPPSGVARIHRIYTDVAYNDRIDKQEIVLSPENSAIMQFANLVPTKRACAIVGFRPSASQLSEGASAIDTRGGIGAIEVWNISITAALDLSTVTYQHRPPRSNYIGSIDFRIGPNSTTREFPCPASGVQTVELRCQTKGCWVRFRERSTAPFLGFELAQWGSAISTA